MGNSWASLGGFGNIAAQGSLPVGQVPAGGVLGMLAQALMQRGAMPSRAQAGQPLAMQDDEELARALQAAFGMPPAQMMPQAGRAGY